MEVYTPRTFPYVHIRLIYQNRLVDTIDDHYGAVLLINIESA